MTRFTDGTAARELRQLITQRLQHDGNGHSIETRKLGTVTIDRFVVGDRLFVIAEAERDAKGAIGTCRLRLADGPDKQSAKLIVQGDSITLHGVPAQAYEQVLATVKLRLAYGPMSFKLGMPYGYVKDGTVTAIAFTSLTPRMRGAAHIVMGEYALRGHELPPVFSLRNTADTDTYMAAFWQAMHQNKVIELYDRVGNRPERMRMISSEQEWPHLLILSDDGLHPRLPAKVPYLLRFAGDKASEGYPRTRATVKRWQAYGSLSRDFYDMAVHVAE